MENLFGMEQLVLIAWHVFKIVLLKQLILEIELKIARDIILMIFAMFFEKRNSGHILE
jgi:hypothetical protein